MNADRLLAEFHRLAEVPDAVPRLRRFILDLAVRGKLVEQDPRDEPASGLLLHIYAERAQRVFDGSIRDSTPHPEATQGKRPFPLPSGWAWARLGALIHLVSGQHLQPGEYSKWEEGGLPYITGPADFGESGLVITRSAVVRKAVARQGQILLTVKGAGVGKTAVCDLPEVAISRQLMALAPLGWSDRFLMLTTYRMAEGLKEAARSLIPGIAREDVEGFLVAMPPLAEQHRIVAKVDELMALCDRLEAAQKERESGRDLQVSAGVAALLRDAHEGAPDQACAVYLSSLPTLVLRSRHVRELRQSIIELSMRGRLTKRHGSDRPASELLEHVKAKAQTLARRRSAIEAYSVADADAPVELPISWRWAHFADVAVVQSNLVSPRDYQDSPHIAPDNIESRTGRLLPYDTIRGSGVTSAKHKFFAGCILYSKIRPGLAKAVIADFDGLCSADMYPILSLINREFMHRYMLSDLFVRQSISEDNRVAMPKINQEALSRVLVPVPPLAEQHRIVAKVDELMGICDRLEEQLRIGQAEGVRLLEAVLHEALAETS